MGGLVMTGIESWEETMDAKVLDGRDLATELVREARVDAAEDRFLRIVPTWIWPIA